MRFIHRVNEGDLLFPGINWTRDRSSKIRIVVKLWRLHIYYRLRSDLIIAKRRHIWDVSFERPMIFDGLEYKFDCRCLAYKDCCISVEILQDIIEQYGLPTDTLENTFSVESLVKTHRSKDNP